MKKLLTFSIIVIGLFLLIFSVYAAHTDDANEEKVLQTMMWLSDPFVNSPTSITYFFDIHPDDINDCCYEVSFELPSEYLNLMGISCPTYNSETLIQNIWVNQKKIADYDEYYISCIPIEEGQYIKFFVCTKGFNEEASSLTITLGKGLKIVPLKKGSFSTRETTIFGSRHYQANYVHIFPEQMKDIVFLIPDGQKTNKKNPVLWFTE